VYLLNPLSLQVAQQLFIAVDRYRVGQNLVGSRDGLNVMFTTPGLEKFSHNLPFLDISIFFNGSRLALLDDYLVMESGGPGTGFDTVMLLVPAPRPDDHLLADYILRAG
jgi:hypothetical protein